MRLAGITIPKQKKVEFALGYVYGVGLTRSREVLERTKIDKNIRVKDLTLEQEDAIRAIVEKEFKTEGELRREVASNIKRLKDIKCFRGTRHAKGLPVRGQRTKTNSRTVRGNKRNLGPSGKKDSAQKT